MLKPARCILQSDADLRNRTSQATCHPKPPNDADCRPGDPEDDHDLIEAIRSRLRWAVACAMSRSWTFQQVLAGIGDGVRKACHFDGGRLEEPSADAESRRRWTYCRYRAELVANGLD